MGQEFFINSEELESKIRQILPSQGGKGAGFDLSASTQIIPIVDLTESAEGSNVRQDLQTALSLSSSTAFDVVNTTTDIVTNTGYFRVFGTQNLFGAGFTEFLLTDGVTTKIVNRYQGAASLLQTITTDFVVFLNAGDTLQAKSSSTSVASVGTTRQIADIDGNLINPT